MQKSKEQYVNYLASHNLLSFATADDKGNPFVRSVEYVNDGPTIYFVTDAKSTKVKQLKKNSNVAFTVDEDLEDWSKIQGIQMRGIASIVGDTEEKEKALDLLRLKFPQLAEMPLEGMEPCVIKIKPTTGSFIDNPAGVGVRHELRFD